MLFTHFYLLQREKKIYFACIPGKQVIGTLALNPYQLNMFFHNKAIKIADLVS